MRNKIFFLFIVVITPIIHVYSQVKSKTIIYQSVKDTTKQNILRETADIDTSELKQYLYTMKDSIMEKEDFENEEEFKDYVDGFLEQAKLMKLAGKPKSFDFLAYRVGDSVYKKTNYLIGYPLAVEIFDLKKLRRYKIDSVYYDNKLRIDTSSLDMDIEKNPDVSVEYKIKITDSIRNILGFKCSLIKVNEKKKFFSKVSSKTIVEENDYDFFVTKALRPNLPIEGVQLIFKKILSDFTALSISMFRSDKRIFQYEAIQIIN